MGNILIKIVLTVIFYLISPVIIPLILVAAAFRFCVAKILPWMDPNLGKILTAHSAAPGTDKIYESPLMTLVTVSTYEGTIDISTLQREFESRVVFARNQSGTLLRPELRQYVTEKWGYNFWKNDQFYSIENHVKLFVPQIKTTEMTPEMVLKESENFVYGPFSSGRSPWEMHVFHNYRDTSYSPISTALALRIHHSLGDGFSILNITNDFLNDNPNNVNEFRSKISYLEIVGRFIRYVVLGPYEFVSSTMDAIDGPDWKVPQHKQHRHFNFGVTPNIPLAKIKAIKSLTKGTFTGVILECFTSALRQFMTDGGYVQIPKEIHCVFPLPMDGHPGRKMRNHMAGCLIGLPIGLENSIDRLRKIENNLTKIRKSTYPNAMFYFMGFVGIFCRCVVKRFTANTITTAIMSNFPGPQKPMDFNGHALLSTYFCGGLFRGSCAMGFSGLSSAGNIRFVFGMDEALVPASLIPGIKLVEYFLQELQVLETQIRKV